MTTTAAELLREAIDTGVLDTETLLNLMGYDTETIDTDTTTVDIAEDGTVTVTEG